MRADDALTARVMHPTGATLAIKYLCKFPPAKEASKEEQEANAEKIKRLMDFADAGGVERMELNLQWLQSALADEPDDYDNKPLKRAIKETRKLIRILNGRGAK